MGTAAAVSVIGVLGVLIGGWPIFKEAAENIAARRMTMELSMSIALVAAVCISQYLTALIITLFVLLAEVLEKMTVSRGRRAIRELLDFLRVPSRFAAQTASARPRPTKCEPATASSSTPAAWSQSTAS